MGGIVLGSLWRQYGAVLGDWRPPAQLPNHSSLEHEQMNNQNSSPPYPKDLSGVAFGRLVVQTQVHPGKRGKWACKCRCGSIHSAARGPLVSGSTRSCGCLQKESIAARNKVHGHHGSREYEAWSAMWDRCTNTQHKAYQRYSDKVPPPEWRDFRVFYLELGPRPGAGYSLDRVKNHLPYGPGNCKWSTSTEQNRNRRSNVLVSFQGRTMSMAEACELSGLSYSLVMGRRSKRSGKTMLQASDGKFDLA